MSAHSQVKHLTSKQTRAFAQQHIPYRVVHLEMCMFAVMLIQRKLADEPGALSVGDSFRFDNVGPRLFTNMAVEAGIVYSRVLLNFLGIYKSQSAPKLVSRRPQDRFASTEVWIERFRGGRLLTISELCAAFPGSQTPQKMYWHIVRTLDAANRGVAHLTLPVRGRSIDGLRSDSLYLTCLATRHHVLNHLYATTLKTEVPQLLQTFHAGTHINLPTA